MSDNYEFYPLTEGQAVSLPCIPHLHFYDFSNEVLSLMEKGASIVHYFGFIENERKELLLILRMPATDSTNKYKLLAAIAYAPSEYLAFTVNCKKFHLFERELYEEFKIRPIGHPNLKPVRDHKEHDKDKYWQLLGPAVHQVGVGPVHAGVIEPGHFRFNCVGERVHHLEIMLGYQHRGIEKLLASLPVSSPRFPIIIEGVAGDSTIAHINCWSRAIEGLLRNGRHDASLADGPTNEISKDEKLLKQVSIIRRVALELERAANHVGDLGALSGDVAFATPAAYFGRIRGEFLNLLLLLSGNRFGKGLIRPWRIRYIPTADTLEKIKNKIEELIPQIKNVGKHLLLSTASVEARFRGVGSVSKSQAYELGMVGIPARATGIGYDVRHSFASDLLTEVAGGKVTPVRISKSGDVWARAELRLLEIFDSLSFLKDILSDPQMIAYMSYANGASNIGSVSGTSSAKDRSCYLPSDIPPSSLIVTMVEGWRGELSHCLITSDLNAPTFLRYKIKDPSFHNWPGLEQALRGEEISDFPLCNKSFNLSYAGFDL